MLCKKGFIMKFIIELIKGMFVGIANIIPGVSGGTMAITFGVYDKIISSITGLFKNFKKSVKTLLPIAIGMVVGIAAFAYLLPYLLKTQPFCTSAAFTGLIVGGIPMIIKSLKEGWNNGTKKSLPVNVIIFIILFAVSLIMPFLSGESESGILLTANAPTMIKVFFLGIIAAATMVIPGVSGSLVLMILGYYFGIITAVKDFLEGLKGLDFGIMLDNGLVLAPFAIGCLVGIFFVSKLIEWLFNNYSSATFSGILGLIVTSPVSIFYKVHQEYSLANTSILQVIIGVIILVACIWVTLYMGKLEEKLDKDKSTSEA
ncbi:MAG: DUF368 domain-containing protein [Lachnospiraceae bacterium]|nr:DUF368 domain-containing protein [Lachnospiraceae bacterium]